MEQTKVGEMNGANALVPVEGHAARDIIPFAGGQTMDMSVLLGTENKPQRFWTSADTSDPKWKAAVFKALQGQDHKAQDVAGKIYLTANIVAQDVQVVDANSGEVKQLTRCVLLDPDGRSVGFCSEGVRNSLRFLMGLYGKPPWEPGLPLVLKIEKARGVGHYYVLDIDIAEMAKRATPPPTKRAR
jgi:hypothetical protein